MDSINEQIQHLRKEYARESLSEDVVHNNPVKQFSNWMNEALNAQVNEPHAMSVATVSSDLKPSSRIVYLRSIKESGFVFYTNYMSRKGEQLAVNNHASLLFFWPELERQVRIEGIVEKVSKEDSDQYFNTRPFENKIGAIASKQSKFLKSREHLQNIFDKLTEEYENKQVLRPEHWGGYILKPELFEFWQGRPGRLHDRLQYVLENDNWIIERLFP